MNATSPTNPRSQGSAPANAGATDVTPNPAISAAGQRAFLRTGLPLRASPLAPDGDQSGQPLPSAEELALLARFKNAMTRSSAASADDSPVGTSAFAPPRPLGGNDPASPLLSGLGGVLGNTSDAASSRHADLNRLLKSTLAPTVRATDFQTPLADIVSDLKRGTTTRVLAPKDEPNLTADSDTLGAAVLQSLQQQASAAAAPIATSPPVAPTGRVEKIEQVIADTVSRILVSDPLHDGRREVRVEFAREVLPDTAVRLWRDAGRLHVEFVASPGGAESALKDGLPRLAAAIQQREPQLELPVVSLRIHDAGGQPGDGRSRQQYYAPPDTEDQA